MTEGGGLFVSAPVVGGGLFFAKIAWQKIHKTRVDESSSKCHIFVGEAVRCKKQKQKRSRDLFCKISWYWEAIHCAMTKITRQHSCGWYLKYLV